MGRLKPLYNDSHIRRSKKWSNTKNTIKDLKDSFSENRKIKQKGKKN